MESLERVGEFPSARPFLDASCAPMLQEMCGPLEKRGAFRIGFSKALELWLIASSEYWARAGLATGYPVARRGAGHTPD